MAYKSISFSKMSVKKYPFFDEKKNNGFPGDLMKNHLL